MVKMGEKQREEERDRETEFHSVPPACLKPKPEYGQDGRNRERQRVEERGKIKREREKEGQRERY